MFNETKEEKEFFKQQNNIQSYQAIDLSTLSDREIQEKQLKLLSEINKNNLSIKSNVQFWFYFTIITIGIGVFVSLTKI
jgi:hypothetical protein